MNPIPSTPMPLMPIASSGYVGVFVFLVMVSVMIIFGMMLWKARPTTRERLSIRCPVRLRRARVRFRLAPDGERIDVLRCSIFGKRPITCGKVCMHTRPVSLAHGG